MAGRGLESKPVGKVSKDKCLAWARKFAAQYSPSVYNNTVGTLRMILAIAVEKGARAQNPAAAITKARIVHRELALPSPGQFKDFLTRMEQAGGSGTFLQRDALNLAWISQQFRGGLGIKMEGPSR